MRNLGNLSDYESKNQRTEEAEGHMTEGVYNIFLEKFFHGCMNFQQK